MGRELLATEPVFHGVVAACDRAIRGAAGWSLLDVLAADEAGSRVHDVEVTQPALFAIHAALFTLLGAGACAPTPWSGTASARSRRPTPPECWRSTRRCT
jgi:acyl transferase domain-containing protein